VETVGEDVFVGRADGLAVLSSCAQAAAAGRAQVVWVEGEAGSGKTALVRQALAALPEGFRVVRAEADELAQEVPYALVSQIAPLRSGQPFGAGLELLEELNRLQEAGPLAVAVEDLHWADRASRDASLTAARRLSEDQVVMLVTSRPNPLLDDGWERFRADPSRCQLLTLGALSVQEVGELARRRGVPLSRAEATRLHAHTNGHPLYVHSLLHELDRAHLTMLEGGLPAPRSFALSTVAQLSELPAEARRLASALAVLNQRVSLSSAARVAGLEQPTAALERLLSTSFVTWWPSEPGTPVAFAHPLYRAAIYEDLSPVRRQELHRAASAVVEPGPALAHRVAAADGPDDELADQVEASARRERQRGAKSLAASQFLSASSLSSERVGTERRLLQAASLLLEDGETARARRLQDRVEACQEGALRSLVLARLVWAQGDALEAERLVLEATDAEPGDGEVAALACALVAALYATWERGEEAVAFGLRALAQHSENPEVELFAWIGLAIGEAMMHGGAAGLGRMAERLPQPPTDVPAADTELLAMRGTLAYWAGRTTASVADLRVVAERAYQGFSATLPRTHMHLAQQLFDSGEWDQAIVHAHVALSLTAGERWTWIETPVHAALGAVLASRGEWDRAEVHLDAARDGVALLGSTESLMALRNAESAVARARGEPAKVVEVLTPLLDDGEGPALPMTAALRWWPALVVAILESGDTEAAARHVERLQAAADRRGLDVRARLVGLEAQLATARGDMAEATERFEQALALLGPDDPLLDRALLHHAFGRFLLQQADRRSARHQLRLAQRLLVGMGADPYRQRVEADLVLAGVRPSPKPAGSSLTLTERERDVATLVATGMTNREVAAHLYFSEKAVEYHLRHVFSKLGVQSRRQLRGLSMATL
jgi:ATP/maltotriose-dependent transcriptional regulator MalT